MKTAIRESGIAFDFGEYILRDQAVLRGIEQVWKVLERWAKGS
jgi:hypothetical protein